MNTIVENFDVFVSGFWVTLQICVLSATGALIIGTLVAVLRISPVPPLQWVGAAYVTVMRNCPLTIIMFFAAFALPVLGTNADFLRIPGLTALMKPLGTDLPFFRFAVIALSVYTAAFVAEAIRSGVNAVSAGQAEAARAIGLTFVQNLRYVVLPQAWKFAIVPLGSVIIAMIKNSALAGLQQRVLVIGLELEDLLEEREGLGIEALFREMIGDARVLLEAFVDLLGAHVQIAERVRAVPIAGLGLDHLDVLGDGHVDLAELQRLFCRLQGGFTIKRRHDGCSQTMLSNRVAGLNERR